MAEILLTAQRLVDQIPLEAHFCAAGKILKVNMVNLINPISRFFAPKIVVDFVNRPLTVRGTDWSSQLIEMPVI